MRTGIAALLAGLLTLRFLPVLPGALWLVGFGLLALGALCLPPFRLPALYALGLCWACASAQRALDDRLPDTHDGRTFWLEGRVVGLPEHQQGVVRFILEDVQSRHDGLPGRLRLAWHGGPAVRAGERWRVAARLKRPHGMVNPQSFDYEAWLLARRIGATGTIKAGRLLDEPMAVSAFRDRLRNRLLQVDAAGRAGALAALVVGDGSGLSTADWRVLQDTGTVHLMVISGQHVSLLAGWLYASVALLARWGLWPWRGPWWYGASALALAGALGYGWLAGFEVPVQRACAMVAAVLAWRLAFRHLGAWLPLALALLLVLLMEPLASLQAGFWLSFASVALLVLAFAGRVGRWRWWQVLWRAQWIMALGLLPMMLALGLPVSLSGPLANMLAVPWVGAVVPVALLGSLALPVPWLGETLLWIAGWALALLMDVLAFLASWQDVWIAPALSLRSLGCVTLGCLLLVSPSGVPGRALGVPLLLPLFFSGPEPPEPGQAEVWMFDVGQGSSMLVRTRHHALLYDAGARQGDFDLGERVVFPSMRHLGVSRLDALLLSHGDNDHAGGAGAIVRSMPVAEVISGEPQRISAELQARPCGSGRRWSWDGVDFSLWQWARAGNGNQASCVLSVEAGGERILLTGDIDSAAERAWLASSMAVPLDWLVLPHHGSRSSSSMALLAATSPSAVLISRSRHNAFGHPHPTVLARVRHIGAQVYDSAEQGAVRIRLGRFEAAWVARSQRRFWR
ncbi:DNA internalization-related competence protein ComEC/Rec2 [Pseudomonas sp. ABC1]|uniref:DNA internalization-related competence protein ComEC/Rec2 n=1 Tax=Pseudomonas sp. ABC1 TaxID=2748080 RepID=UPI0015C32102|nr:DNA internalization-related competence protein ComEC/Rec2 [Pseudomonas sp. ABC1]QLF93039.1 DNA internalization-related competence protein ComEC/Rec2 [Pseudomonas sp. ABC1]